MRRRFSDVKHLVHTRGSAMDTRALSGVSNPHGNHCRTGSYAEQRTHLGRSVSGADRPPAGGRRGPCPSRAVPRAQGPAGRARALPGDGREGAALGGPLHGPYAPLRLWGPPLAGAGLQTHPRRDAPGGRRACDRRDRRSRCRAPGGALPAAPSPVGARALTRAAAAGARSGPYGRVALAFAAFFRHYSPLRKQPRSPLHRTDRPEPGRGGRSSVASPGAPPARSPTDSSTPTPK